MPSLTAVLKVTAEAAQLEAALDQKHEAERAAFEASIVLSSGLRVEMAAISTSCRVP